MQTTLNFEEHTRQAQLQELGMTPVFNEPAVSFAHIVLPDAVVNSVSDGVFNSMVKLLKTKINKLHKSDCYFHSPFKFTGAVLHSSSASGNFLHS